VSEETQVAKQEESMSTRFMNAVVREFSGSVGEVALTNFQKRLAQNYFIAVDQALVKAEQRRDNKKNNLPVVWANVDMKQLALDVVAAARVGLDPAQPNHINMVPYRNNRTKKYNIGFIDGYRGIEMKAVKYGLDIPDDVTIELVYANDTFKPIKKDHRNKVESYEFEVSNPFDRGEIVGGFYYHAYKNNPEKNKLVVMSLKDILKRKPEYASKEFWGKDGWYEKMCHKTIHRAAYRDITIDSQKIDDDYLRLKKQEELFSDREIEAEIEAEANGPVIDIEYTEPEEVVTDGEPEPEKNEKPAKTEQKPPEKAQKDQKADPGQQTIGGPGF
jgi:recombination protein RecT